MKKNVLFVYELSEKEMDFIIEKLSHFSSSNFIKFKVIKDNIIINFSTTMDFCEIDQVVELIFSNLDKKYFLIEYGENMSVCLPDNQSEQFLNTSDAQSTMMEESVIDETRGRELLKELILSMSEEEIEDEDDEDYDDFLFKKPKRIEMKLDDILDKIKDKGIETLTTEEKNFLNNLYK